MSKVIVALAADIGGMDPEERKQANNAFSKQCKAAQKILDRVAEQGDTISDLGGRIDAGLQKMQAEFATALKTPGGMTPKKVEAQTAKLQQLSSDLTTLLKLASKISGSLR